MSQGPDFIIIGAMKSATSTLHAQLAVQPGLCMSRPKEPNYFSDDRNFAKGWDWYCAHFEGAAEGDLRGESSTHYTKLPTFPETVARMRQALPGVKLIYLMRDPIERLVSHYLHEYIRGTITVSIEEAIGRYPELVAYSKYGMQIRPYLDAFGPRNILPVFFERLIASPQAEQERLCRFIGYVGSPRWDFLMKAQNVTRDQLRRSALRELVVTLPLLNAIRHRWVPRSWNERLKALWKMRTDRPKLLPETVARLREVFDADLEQLGAGLGIEIDCERFSSLARAGPHGWIEADGRPSYAQSS